MSTAVADRDAIVAKAIEIASAEERGAFLAQACGGDAALRRQVEELVAAHLRQAGQEKSNGTTVHDTVSPRRLPHQAGANYTANHTHSTDPAHPSAKEKQKMSRGVVMTGTILLLSATLGSVCVAVWSWRAEEHARVAAAQAIDDGKKAKMAQEEAEHQREDCAGDAADAYRGTRPGAGRHAGGPTFGAGHEIRIVLRPEQNVVGGSS